MDINGNTIQDLVIAYGPFGALIVLFLIFIAIIVIYQTRTSNALIKSNAERANILEDRNKELDKRDARAAELHEKQIASEAAFSEQLRIITSQFMHAIELQQEREKVFIDSQQQMIDAQKRLDDSLNNPVRLKERGGLMIESIRQNSSVIGQHIEDTILSRLETVIKSVLESIQDLSDKVENTHTGVKDIQVTLQELTIAREQLTRAELLLKALLEKNDPELQKPGTIILSDNNKGL